MRIWKFPQSMSGHVVSAVMMSLFAMGPVACNSLNIAGISAGFGLQGDPLGFLFNTDFGSDVLGGIRLEDGNEAFVYGKRYADGSIKEITGAALRDVDGNEASILFENGRPTKARGFDGSTVAITYEEVSSDRLSGHVDLFFADPAVAEEDRHQTLTFDVDLREAAAELAERVSEWLGLEISDAEPAASPPGRPRLADSALAALGKDAPDAQFILGLVVLPYQFAFMAMGFLCIQIMTQVVAVMVGTILTLVATLTRAIVVAVFSPIIIMCEMMRMAVGLSAVAIDFSIRLTGTGVIIPRHPRF
jgi:hypothetical protein